MEPIITHFTDTDLYKLTMCCAILNCYPRAMAKYKFVDRNNTVYPPGFGKLVEEQIIYLENLRFTEEERIFMQKRCYYIPQWFFTYLKGFRFKRDWVNVHQDEEGHLEIMFEGYWHETVLLEVMILAIISELHHRLSGELDKIDLRDYYKMSYDKARRMLSAGLCISEFGTRRRFSLATEDMAVKAFMDADRDLRKELGKEYKGSFPGTSNVWLALKYNVIPIGTMAHEFVSAIAGMYGPQEANHIAMDMWQRTFIGSLGIFLYDTYGFDAFAANFSEHFARVFAGLRVDSGNNLEQLEKICNRYHELGLDPSTKQVVFSNALDEESAIELHKAVNGRVIDSYGIGTALSADGALWDIKPSNIVIKLLGIKMTEKRHWSKTCKMSEDKGKVTGDSDIIQIFNYLLHRED
ncbi:nicotinate phosphoribosyltransferase [Palleniella muris]|uniref:Nicotinate phosphoribosyltransferase n=1 Tax=Palleniella muris TaxID=3038145 RepID=A0AC61QSU2_9BACT|nr:nicotinate phosphoribosyltransferase [Palleniella muris]TGX83525.1 nicotinate phosphoribosyltransferase [Palleniella muris]